MKISVKLGYIDYGGESYKHTVTQPIQVEVGDDTSLFGLLSYLRNANNLSPQDTGWGLEIKLSEKAIFKTYTGYGLDYNDGIIFLPGCTWMKRDYTFSELQKLHDFGIVKGSLDDITIEEAQSGLGGGNPLEIIKTIVELFVLIVPLIKFMLRAKKIYRDWNERNLISRNDMTNFLGLNKTWGVDDLSKLLRLNKDTLARFMSRNGYDISADGSIYSLIKEGGASVKQLEDSTNENDNPLAHLRRIALFTKWFF